MPPRAVTTSRPAVGHCRTFQVQTKNGPSASRFAACSAAAGPTITRSIAPASARRDEPQARRSLRRRLAGEAPALLTAFSAVLDVALVLVIFKGDVGVAPTF